MKKLIHLSFIICAIFIGSKSQSQSINLSNFITTSYEATNIYSIDSHVTVENTIANPINVNVERTIGYLVPGQDELFCFGSQCYAPGTAYSTTPTSILAGKSVDLKASVSPNGNSGVTSLHYRIINFNNTADSIGIDLNFNFGATGISENKEDFGMSKALRNPADGFTLFSYNLPVNEVSDKLVVFNMLGSFVKSMDVNGLKGTIVMNTSELTSGIYLVSYMSGNKVRSTSKLVVRHN